MPSDEFTRMYTRFFASFLQKNFAEVFAQNPASPFTRTGISQFCSSIASPLRAHFVCSIAQVAHKCTGLQ